MARERRGGGRSRRAAQAATAESTAPAYIKRKIPYYEVLDDASLSIIEENAEVILEEIGIDFTDDEETMDIFRDAGASIDGDRVRFPRGMCRELIQATAQKEFTQHARNPKRNVQIGGDNMVLVPAYGPPFVYDLDGGRRYATIEDFNNFVKLAYMSENLHHSGGTICEPVDLPVNKRHFDMVYAHIKYSDKAFMGSVTAPERAEDSVAMAKIVFGDEFVDQNCVMINLINANSPMAFDGTMVGGMSLIQLLRPGAPLIYGNFVSSMSMQSGAPTFGTPEAAQVMNIGGALARRLGVPFRSGGGFTSSKLPDAQAGYEAANTLNATLNAGVNFALHTAGWLEGGLSMGYEKFIMDADQAGMLRISAQGVDMSENGQAMDALREVGPGQHFLGCEHTQRNFKTAFYPSSVSDNNSFEAWVEDGSQDTQKRANAQYKKMLAEYQPPPLDPEIDAKLIAYMDERKSSFEDSNI